MNSVTAMRRPMTPLAEACPPYRRALDEFEKQDRAGNADAASRAWAAASEIAEAFRLGTEFGATEAGRAAR